MQNHIPFLSERLRQLIDEKIGEKKTFEELEDLSQISRHKWKNFYYGKQNATKEMINFWLQYYPADVDFLSNGSPDFVCPFNIKYPTLLERETIRDRLLWVISEWCADVGSRIFKTLESRSGGKISSQAWYGFVARKEFPTADMVEFVCVNRPQFTCWILLGSLSYQVDPTDQQSVKGWIAKI